MPIRQLYKKAHVLYQGVSKFIASYLDTHAGSSGIYEAASHGCCRIYLHYCVLFWGGTFPPMLAHQYKFKVFVAYHLLAPVGATSGTLLEPAVLVPELQEPPTAGYLL